jgi:hypothetical protein
MISDLRKAHTLDKSQTPLFSYAKLGTHIVQTYNRTTRQLLPTFPSPKMINRLYHVSLAS